MPDPKSGNRSRGFVATRSALTGLDPAAAEALVTAVADVALIVDEKGVVRSVAHSGADALTTVSEDWVGRPWVETVTPETRGKIDALLRDAVGGSVGQRRQVNHMTRDGDIPVSYAAVRLGEQGLVMAVGRDMRAVSTLQQRLVETQQAMERDYWKLRHVETRYRLLFQLSTEAVIVVDASNFQVLDGNAAAAKMFELPLEKLIGKTFPVGVAAADVTGLEDYLTRTRATGRGGEITVHLAGEPEPVRLSASCFRQDQSTLFLIRLSTNEAALPSPEATTVRDLVGLLPDGFVMTRTDGQILSANRAFMDLVQVSGEERLAGTSLGDWIGRPGADLGVMLSTLKKHNVLRVLATSLNGEHGGVTEVEVSGIAAPTADPPCLAFVVRDVGRRIAAGPQGARDLTRAVEQLTGLVGRVALPDLLRDTVDLVERHFIEAALELTHDNRTAAAEVLGLSRQSLYIKMRRYRLHLPEEAEEAG